MWDLFPFVDTFELFGKKKEKRPRFYAHRENIYIFINNLRSNQNEKAHALS